MHIIDWLGKQEEEFEIGCLYCDSEVRQVDWIMDGEDEIYCSPDCQEEHLLHLMDEIDNKFNSEIHKKGFGELWEKIQDNVFSDSEIIIQNLKIKDIQYIFENEPDYIQHPNLYLLDITDPYNNNYNHFYFTVLQVCCQHCKTEFEIFPLALFELTKPMCYSCQPTHDQIKQQFIKRTKRGLSDWNKLGLQKIE